MELVRSKTGAPSGEDFRSSTGTPIVVDQTAATGKIYFLDDAGTIREAGDNLTSATVSALTAITVRVSATATFAGLIDASEAGAGQVKFPATQNASADANTLDDYEEGTTTPTPTAGGGSFTSVSAAVNYTKIGNLVRVRVAVTITTNGTAATYVSIPMPFNASETTAIAGSHNSGTYGLCGYVTAGNMIVFKYDGTYPGADGTTLQMSCVYRV